MMDLNELYNTGNDILKEVNRAVDTGDYSELSDTIRGLVADAVRGKGDTGYRPPYDYTRNMRGRREPAENTGKGKAYDYTRGYGTSSADGPAFGQMGGDVRNESGPRVISYEQTTHYSGSKKRITPFLQRKISSTSAVFKMIGGILGTVVFGSLTLSFLITSLTAIFTGRIAGGVAGFVATAIMGTLLGICIYLIVSGKSTNDLIGKYYQFGRTLGDATFFSIKELARRTGESAERLRDDIKKMIENGFLPQARMDENETTVMLTEEAYEQYLQAEEQRRDREAKEAAARPREAAQPADIPEEVKSIIAEGNSYINLIRQINDEIPDTDEMSGKLYHLEETMRKIFAQVERDPSCAGELRKLMNYYLPTTEKLLRAYADLDRNPAEGSNIAKTKREIEDALVSINGAFEKLLDGLFQDMAWDISSDISVMKTMLAQDGLTAAPGPGKDTTTAVPGPKQVMRSDGTIETLE